MHSHAPKIIAINHDDYHAKHVGRASDGRQFLLTTPFVPGREGNEFVALYLFDEAGALLEAQIDEFGSRDAMDEAAVRRMYEARLAGLGDVSFERIEVAPFRIERFGVEFGLISEEPEDEDDTWWVTMEPGDYMAFSEPWGSGDYDT
ncbi:hypothetical protein [Catellatospora vulcania]|uniref:hypothetical protein n=1 Tax=Catellatospora vulcania TaxID=1460450 RepID=UPI0012D45A40|nr:hypothetical protein [Catellatospora vulcania]